MLTLDYANCLSPRVGSHGLDPARLAPGGEISDAIAATAAKLAKTRGTGWERWRNLPFDPMRSEHVAGVKKIIVVMEHNAKDGSPKFIPACTLPLTGKNVVDMIVTDLAVFQRPDHASPFKLIETAPGVTADEIKAKTTAQYIV